MAVTREQAQAWADADRRPAKQVDELVRYGEGAACYAEYTAWATRSVPKRKTKLTTETAVDLVETSEA